MIQTKQTRDKEKIRKQTKHQDFSKQYPTYYELLQKYSDSRMFGNQSVSTNDQTKNP